jgi:hypothetical protein
MNRYILNETIKHFQQIMAEDISQEERKYAAAEVASMQRELALMDAASLGVQRYAQEIAPASSAYKRRFQPLLKGSPEALLVIDPRPGLHIVDMTPSFEAATLADRDRALGGSLFDVFPDNPEIPDAEGVTNILNSLRAAAHSGWPQAMAVQRYDVRDADGPFVERHWRPYHAPIFDDAGVLVWLLIRLEHVTAQHRP